MSDNGGIPASSHPDKEILLKKGELILAGTLVLHRSVQLPFPLSRSTAGPDTGQNTLMIGFQGTRVKMKATRNEGDSRFTLIFHDKNSRGGGAGNGDGSYTLLKDDDVFLENVQLVPTVMHAPEQAFINIDARCRYGCLFCASPHLRNYRRILNDRWIELIQDAAQHGRISGIALTSGIPGTIEENINDFVDIIKGVTGLSIPIGVEPYVETVDQIKQLKDAGAQELKLNIQSWDRGIFKKICPDLNYDHILHMLEHGVRIFGKNRVTSNIIIGFGETDDMVLDGIETLAVMGIAATVRLLHLNPLNIPALSGINGLGQVTKERLMYLREKQTEIFLKHGMDPGKFKTMCFPCKGCDLEPFLVSNIF